MTDSTLVSVVIPAYNAEATLDETLRSVRAQTHRALEIIVVDDGSTDKTREVAERHAAVDSRIHVISQNNAGVAAARNAGWTRARSDLIAFVDADDLWVPTKIERQLRALRAGGDEVGLVYCWSIRISGASEMSQMLEGSRVEGDVLRHALVSNIVGNGSSALVRRQALVYANGFDSRLRQAGAEGCEDRLLYCRVAEKYRFALVPEYLIGYRYLADNMSSDRPRMLRSWLLVHDELLVRHPMHADALKRGLRGYGISLLHDAVSNKAFEQLPAIFLVMLRHSSSIALLLPLLIVFGELRLKVPELLSLNRESTTSRNVLNRQRFPVGELN